MSANDAVPIGALVEVPAGCGIVRFNGTTEFSTGRWIGIELSEPNGKNNGTVHGVPYFQCAMNFGVFVRPSQVKVIAENQSPAPSTTPPAAIISPPSHVRTLSTGRVRSSSVRSGTTPSPRAESPRVQPTPLSASRMRPPSSAIASKKPTLRIPAPVTGRLSISRPSQILTTTSRLSTAPDSIPTTPVSQKPSRLVESTAFVESPTLEPPEIPAPLPSTPARESGPLPALSFPAITPPSNSPSARSDSERSPTLTKSAHAAAEQELQELRAKIRVLEAKRTDDSRVIEKLESQLADVNHFVSLRPKLQQKLATLQQEVIANRREIADLGQLKNIQEGRMLDMQEQLEMAMLDKEVAEERAEAAELEIQSLQERVESLEVELASIKEGIYPDGGEVEDSVKKSLAYNQLEKHNERLKEALVRLRDISRENEQDQRRRIAELERELQGVEVLHSQYDSVLGKLSNAETQVEELKAQLDDALGAEEMLEQLTERNLVLGEKIAEMTITIEDLEALKELNDELEENHIETEKQLQEEMEQKDTQIRERSRRIGELEDACTDFENTINQFRDLVFHLQGELESLRTQTQNAQDESANAASQTAEIMSRNLKLQSSASKARARHIELELRKIELRETKEMLNIVQPYLPQLYIETDRIPTECYLYFQRMAAKADLINSVVANIHGLPESLNRPVTDALVRTCEMRGLISRVSTLCKRFATILRRCDVESFLTIGRVYPEISHLEKRFDTHIDLLIREEFRDLECYADMIKASQQYEHLAETYFNAFDQDLGDREFGFAQSFDNDLDLFSASLSVVHTSLNDIMKDQDVTIENDDEPDSKLLSPLQRLLDQCKNAKALSRKLMRRMEELMQESSALKPQLLPQLRNLTNVELLNFGVQLGQTITPYLADIRMNKGTLHTKAVLEFVHQIASATVGKGKKGEVSWDTVGAGLSSLIQDAGTVIPLALEAESVIKMGGVAPWVTRVNEVKAALAVNVEAELKVTHLNEEIQELARRIRTRDQTIQESNVKIELMERRMDTVKKQADAILSLESEIAKARKQERSYEEAIEQLQSDLDILEQDNAKLKQITAGMEKQPSVGPQLVDTENAAAVESNLETSHLLDQIEALRGAARYLRRENTYLKGQELLKEIQALPPIPKFSSRADTPPLDLSNSSSESDSDIEEIRTPSLRSLATESSLLYRDVLHFSSSLRVVDLSAINDKMRANVAHHGHGWMPKKKTPSHQLLEQKEKAGELSRRFRGLLEKASALGVS